MKRKKIVKTIKKFFTSVPVDMENFGGKPKWTPWKVIDFSLIWLGYIYIIIGIPLGVAFKDVPSVNFSVRLFGSLLGARVLTFALKGFLQLDAKLAFLKGKVKAQEEMLPIIDDLQVRINNKQLQPIKINEDLVAKNKPEETLKRFIDKNAS